MKPKIAALTGVCPTAFAQKLDEKRVDRQENMNADFAYR
jgi:hypothetical protein